MTDASLDFYFIFITARHLLLSHLFNLIYFFFIRLAKDE